MEHVPEIQAPGSRRGHSLGLVANAIAADLRSLRREIQRQEEIFQQLEERLASLDEQARDLSATVRPPEGAARETDFGQASRSTAGSAEKREKPPLAHPYNESGAIL